MNLKPLNVHKINDGIKYEFKYFNYYYFPKEKYVEIAMNVPGAYPFTRIKVDNVKQLFNIVNKFESNYKEIYKNQLITDKRIFNYLKLFKSDFLNRIYSKN